MVPFSRILIGIFILLTIVFLSGPRVQGIGDTDVTFEIPSEPRELEQFVRDHENAYDLKPDNEARIIWSDTASPRQTEYALVYLHGFSASQEEGDPVHEEFTRRYGMNAYFARIAGHGLNTSEPFIDLTARKMIESAEEALAIGRQLGKKVVLMSCSTGGTLSLYLASKHPDVVYALILYSPNVDVYDKSARVLTFPWGLQIGQLVTNSRFREWSPPDPARQYWYARYRLEGAAALKVLVDETMTRATFEQIEQPLLLLYYEKNERERDFVVSIDRMKEMFDQVSTPADQKRAFAMPEVGNHVLCSKFFSQDLEGVRERTINFAEEILGLESVNH